MYQLNIRQYTDDKQVVLMFGLMLLERVHINSLRVFCEEEHVNTKSQVLLINALISRINEHVSITGYV